jgi:isopropylmalate/homocitrate/citramalate synthase
MSAQHPWQTDRWFVSPWNYVEEVRAQLQFPPRIQIHDVTLRDGEQQAGVIFTKEDKIRIAEALAELGVHRIEAGMPAVSPDDAEAIREIVKRNLGPKIYAFSRCMVEDIKRAVDCGVSGVVVEIPSSAHLIQHAYRWPLQKAIDLSVEATAYAHEQGLEVVFFPIDFTRADIHWVLDLITRVARDGHMDALVLVDTFGVCSPHAMSYFVRNVKERVNVRLEAHFHMDFGLGVANTLIALANGVEVMHTTVLGLGERAGNTPMEETVMALLALYGIDLGINYAKLYEVARLVRELSGQCFPTNKPVVGDGLFQIESGIIASWFRNCGYEKVTELFPYRWEVVGQRPAEVVLGKGSGLDSVKMWLERLGVQATEEEAGRILMAVKAHSLRTKRLLSEEEFREIVEEILGPERVPAR